MSEGQVHLENQAPIIPEVHHIFWKPRQAPGLSALPEDQFFCRSIQEHHLWGWLQMVEARALRRSPEPGLSASDGPRVTSRSSCFQALQRRQPLGHSAPSGLLGRQYLFPDSEHCCLQVGWQGKQGRNHAHGPSPCCLGCCSRPCPHPGPSHLWVLQGGRLLRSSCVLATGQMYSHEAGKLSLEQMAETADGAVGIIKRRKTHPETGLPALPCCPDGISLPACQAPYSRADEQGAGPVIRAPTRTFLRVKGGHE